MKSRMERASVWDLAEKIFVQLHSGMNQKNLKTSEIVKMSYKIAEEFYDQRNQDLQIPIED